MTDEEPSLPESFGRLGGHIGAELDGTAAIFAGTIGGYGVGRYVENEVIPKLADCIVDQIESD